MHHSHFLLVGGEERALSGSRRNGQRLSGPDIDDAERERSRLESRVLGDEDPRYPRLVLAAVLNYRPPAWYDSTMDHRIPIQWRGALQIGSGVCIITAITMLSLADGPPARSRGVYSLLAFCGYVAAGFVGGMRARHPVQQAALVGATAFLVGVLWGTWETWDTTDIEELAASELLPTVVGLVGNCLVTALGGMLADIFTLRTEPAETTSAPIENKE